MEPGNDTEMQPQNYRYSIPRLAEIGCRTNIAVYISLFNAEAIQGQSASYTASALLSPPSATLVNHNLLSHNFVNHNLLSYNFVNQHTDLTSSHSWYRNRT
jgi:hypothetical protein